MIRTRLTYHAPTSVDQACSLLAERGDGAAVLGGGTWLVPLMTRGERTVTDVVDLRGLDLAGIVAHDGEVELGAMTTYADVLSSSVLQERAPLLHVVAAAVTGGRQIHNLGTIGGSACFAFPSSDVPACLVALCARMRVEGVSGVREVPAGEFFLDAFRPALAPAEILTAIVLPAVAGGVGYEKLKLCESSWPIVTAAAVVAEGDAEHGPEAAVTLGGVGRVPLRIELAELLDDGRASEITTQQLDGLVAERLDEAWDDELAAGSYRSAVAGAIARRALQKAMEDTAR